MDCGLWNMRRWSKSKSKSKSKFKSKFKFKSKSKFKSKFKSKSKPTSIPFKNVTRIDFFCHIIKTCVVAVGDDGLALGLET